MAGQGGVGSGLQLLAEQWFLVGRDRQPTAGSVLRGEIAGCLPALDPTRDTALADLEELHDSAPRHPLCVGSQDAFAQIG